MLGLSDRADVIELFGLAMRGDAPGALARVARLGVPAGS